MKTIGKAIVATFIAINVLFIAWHLLLGAMWLLTTAIPIPFTANTICL